MGFSKGQKIVQDKKKIASWWAENPMTYGQEHGKTAFREGEETVEVEFGSREFFGNADRQFIEWNRPLHNNRGHFGKIFPYDEFSGHSVLEIGCGMGYMAMLWVGNGARVTAVDLNPVSITQTRKRFKLFGLEGRIQQEDANSLSFPDGSFDYVYSWGVLHHSPDLERSVSEFFRVLKPGGKFGIMLYNRKSFLHLYHTVYVEGFLHGESLFLDRLQLASRYGDGHRQEGNPHTWPVTEEEMRQMITQYAGTFKIKLLGTELDSTFKYMLPGLYYIVPRVVKKAWARRFGWSIWIEGRKAEK